MSSSAENDCESVPIQNQPYLLRESNVESRPLLPPGLEQLTEVDEVKWMEGVFQTRDGQDLFFVHHKTRCCGPSENITLKIPGKKTVAFFHLSGKRGCCDKSVPSMSIETPRGSPAGYVEVSRLSSKLMFFIKNTCDESTYTAELTCSLHHDQTIQIFHEHGELHVAQISKSKEKNSKGTSIQFPLDMDVKMKVVILGTFLFMNYCLHQTSDDQGYGFDAGNLKPNQGNCEVCLCACYGGCEDCEQCDSDCCEGFGDCLTGCCDGFGDCLTGCCECFGECLSACFDILGCCSSCFSDY